MTNEKQDLASYLRDDLSTLPTYVPVQPLSLLSYELGIPVKNLVKLDANENPHGPVEEISKALNNAEELNLHIYPDPDQKALRDELTFYTRNIFPPCTSWLNSTHIVAGFGSDELLDVIFKLVDPSLVLIPSPSFGMYSFLSKINGADYLEVPRTPFPDFEIDVDEMFKAVEGKEGRKLLFLASPNNPTGGSTRIQVLRKLLNLPNTFIVLDQAYAEFDSNMAKGQNFDNEDSNSALDLIKQHENLLILRTFSKWAGLAGMRAGYGLSNESLVKSLLSLKQPYNITAATSASCIAALKNWKKIYKEQIYEILCERQRLLTELSEFSFIQACPTDSNFILLKVLENEYGLTANDLYSKLRGRGILTRYYSSKALAGFFRISVGKKQDTDRVIAAMNEIISEKDEVRNVEGLIWDMDGVLADVSKSYRTAIEQTCVYFGANITQKDIEDAKEQGNANNDWVLTQTLIKLKTGKNIALDTVTEKFQEIYIPLSKLESLLVPKSVLVEVRRRVKAMGIVTGRPRRECLTFLRAHNIETLFTNSVGEICLVCMEDANPKPSPDPVILCRKKLGLDGRLAMLGDTPDDIIAASKAKVIALGVKLSQNQPESYLSKLCSLGAKTILDPGCLELLSVIPPKLVEVRRTPLSVATVAPSVVTIPTGKRYAEISRNTSETKVSVKVNLDGTGKNDISTGIGFLDHMLTAFSKHSRIDLFVKAVGDLWIDDHHTTEDVGIALGECLDKALGQRKGISRWGYALCPLDESVARAVVDISSRPFALVDLKIEREMIGTVSSEMLEHFVESFATSARICVHLEVIKGKNAHHKAESGFKSLAVAMKKAICFDSTAGVPSTKGVLT
eukprot:snap_masked-scaffold_43-processed-gene-1.54-mRNA-1 protein AED:0.01 eAED:0.04 QI:0/-1/0/1/-1/1/1/0/850